MKGRKHNMLCRKKNEKETENAKCSTRQGNAQNAVHAVKNCLSIEVMHRSCETNTKSCIELPNCLEYHSRQSLFL